MINRKIALKKVYNPKVTIRELEEYLQTFETLDRMAGLPIESRIQNQEIEEILRKAIADRKVLEAI